MKGLILLLAFIWLTGCRAEDDSEFQRFVGTQKFGFGQVSSQIVIVMRQEGVVITGGVTPPGKSVIEPFTNGQMDGITVRFDRREGSITYRYQATLQDPQLRGNFDPLGCVVPSSGEPCLTDSNGSFTSVRVAVP